MHTNGIVKHFEEHQTEILTAKVLRKARQRTADISASLTRRGAAQAKAEILNTAMFKLIDMLYQVDPDGYPANIGIDGRIEIAAPWGSTGRPKWGLLRGEGDCLRRYLQHLQTLKRPVRLFYFEEEAGRWYLDAFTYQTKTAALEYWQIVSLNAAAWRRFSVQKPSKDHA